MKAGNRAALIILAVAVLVLLFLQTPLMRGVRGSAWNALTVSTGRVFRVGSLTLTKDVDEQLQRLQAENISLKSQLKEYERLKSQLSVPTLSSLRSIPAAVVGRPLDPFQNRYVLSKGIRDGVVLGSPVVSSSTFLGFIVDVTERTSTMELLFTPTTSLTAEVVPEDPDLPPVKGLLTGHHYTSVLLSTIPRDVKISPGQAVVTSANEFVPQGLFIGKVGEVVNKENEPYQTAQVLTSYTPSALEAVTILVEP